MARNREKRKFNPLLWGNYFLIIILLLSNLTPIIAPDLFWPITILGLAFPIIVMINLLFVIYWTVVFKRYLFYSLIALILSYSLIFDHLQLSSIKKDPDSTDIALSILSFNAHNLSNNNFNRGDKAIRDSIMHFVNKQKADIVCFQEFQNYPTRGVHSVDEYQRAMGHLYVQQFPYLIKNTHEFVDLMVLYSKFPILNSHPYYMDGKSYGFYTDLVIRKDTIRLFNLHLESNHFSKNDYEIFSEKEVNLNERKINQIVLLLQKIKKYSVKRSYQARTIRADIDTSPYSVIVAGDFNDTPASFTTHHVRKDLKDAFREKGIGYGNTFNGALPPMRIDYLLFEEHMEIMNFQILKTELSDHYPVMAQFTINQ